MTVATLGSPTAWLAGMFSSTPKLKCRCTQACLHYTSSPAWECSLQDTSLIINIRFYTGNRWFITAEVTWRCFFLFFFKWCFPRLDEGTWSLMMYCIWKEICSNTSNASSALRTVTTTTGNTEWSFPAPSLEDGGWYENKSCDVINRS